MGRRGTTADRAWPEKKPAQQLRQSSPQQANHEVVPISLDASAVADAIRSQLKPSDCRACPPQTRSSNDERLILFLTVGIGVLALTSILCALISVLITSHSARTIAKLHLLLQ